MNRKQLSMFLADEHVLLAEAMQKIDDNARGILFVTDGEKRLCGAVSDGDIRRWILKTGVITAEIKSLMNPHPKYLLENESFDPYTYMRKYSIHALPVVDSCMRIKDILLVDNQEMELDKDREGLENVTVVIMAGGKGTRLYPYTKILPKPLIPIGDIPIVERIINYFHEYNITDFIMTVNYRKNMIKSYFSEIDKDYEIEYVEEDKPLGTAGSIKLIKRQFDQPLFVANCDSLIRADYTELLRFHKKSGNAITIVSAMKNDVIPYGVVYSKENGEIENMVEKPRRSYFVNTGMYVINPEMIELIPDDTFFHMTDLTEKAIENGYRVGMYPVSEDSFLDMGEFEEMKRMEEKLNLE